MIHCTYKVGNKCFSHPICNKLCTDSNCIFFVFLKQMLLKSTGNTVHNCTASTLAKLVWEEISNDKDSSPATAGR